MSRLGPQRIHRSLRHDLRVAAGERHRFCTPRRMAVRVTPAGAVPLPQSALGRADIVGRRRTERLAVAGDDVVSMFMSFF
jgi:hypothetical protein